MRSDLFVARKCIHVKLNKELHYALRQKLFKHGLTMQEIFVDAAEAIVEDSEASERIIFRISKKKMNAEIEKVRNNNLHIGEFDADTMYSLIEDEANEKPKAVK